MYLIVYENKPHILSCFLSPQPNFKDYPVYLTKFRQCLSKALHLLKTHIINTLQTLTNQLTKRVCELYNLYYYSCSSQAEV